MPLGTFCNNTNNDLNIKMILWMSIWIHLFIRDNLARLYSVQCSCSHCNVTELFDESDQTCWRQNVYLSGVKRKGLEISLTLDYEI